MSCSYHVWCRDCGEQNELEAEHDPGLIRALLRHADALAAMGPVLGEAYSLELRTAYGRVDPSWFSHHRGHHLVVRNEYGVIESLCPKLAQCCHCGTRTRCVSLDGHEGECDTKGSGALGR